MRFSQTLQPFEAASYRLRYSGISGVSAIRSATACAALQTLHDTGVVPATPLLSLILQQSPSSAIAHGERLMTTGLIDLGHQNGQHGRGRVATYVPRFVRRGKPRQAALTTITRLATPPASPSISKSET